MSNVEFESDNMGFNKLGSSKSTMIGWLIRHGIVRSENVGQSILIAFIAFNFIASFLILKYFGAF